MHVQASDWREWQRARTIALFRVAWEQSPASGRAALVEAAARDRVGHRWSSGRGACVLALLARPVLRSGESAKAAAYRLFGCEVTDDLPVTWDAGGITLAELLDAVGAPLPKRGPRGMTARAQALVPRFLRSLSPVGGGA